MEKHLMFLLVVLALYSCGRTGTAKTGDMKNRYTDSAEASGANDMTSIPGIAHFSFSKTSKSFESGAEGVGIGAEFDFIPKPQSVADDSVNALILSFIGDMLGADKSFRTADDVQKFIKVRFREVMEGSDELEMQWYEQNVNCSISTIMDGIISVACDGGGFTGGAHPNYVSIYRHYYKDSGKPLDLASIFSDSEKVNEVAEKIFRQQWEIPGDQALDEAGFWFDEEGFRLNDNFRFGQDTVIFYFNTYEIAPYYMGPTELKLPLKDIRRFWLL